MSAALPLAESEDLVLVRDSARGLLQGAWPASRAVAMGNDPAALKDMWRKAAAQGWTALAPSQDEMGLAAAIVLMQELGRAVCAIPLADAVLANAVLSQAQGEAAAQLLAGVQSAMRSSRGRSRGPLARCVSARRWKGPSASWSTARSPRTFSCRRANPARSRSSREAQPD